jgi:hypothetical protein
MTPKNVIPTSYMHSLSQTEGKTGSTFGPPKTIKKTMEIYQKKRQ